MTADSELFVDEVVLESVMEILEQNKIEIEGDLVIEIPKEWQGIHRYDRFPRSGEAKLKIRTAICEGGIILEEDYKEIGSVKWRTLWNPPQDEWEDVEPPIPLIEEVRILDKVIRPSTEITVSLWIDTLDVERFVDELEALCRKYAVDGKSYYFTFKS